MACSGFCPWRHLCGPGSAQIQHTGPIPTPWASNAPPRLVWAPHTSGASNTITRIDTPKKRVRFRFTPLPSAMISPRFDPFSDCPTPRPLPLRLPSPRCALHQPSRRRRCLPRRRRRPRAVQSPSLTSHRHRTFNRHHRRHC